MPSFSPDFMEGVAPELSPQQNKNVNLTTHESSMIGVDIDPKKGLCNKNSLGHQYCMEPMEEKHNDLLSKKKDDIAKKPFPTEIPVVVDTAEKDSSFAPLFCRVNKSDDERWDGQEDLSTPVSLDGYHSCVKEAETTNHVNATADKSNVLPPANSVILVEFCKCRVSDTVLTSGDAFSAISNDSVGLGLSYPIKFLNQKIMFPLQILVNTNARESMKKIILASVRKKWREWKCRVKKIGYKPFNNDTDRLTYRPEGVHDISGGTWSITGALGRHSF
ncbi:hypothetical protein ACSBR1_027508 [Camellia fascicularis]